MSDQPSLPDSPRQSLWAEVGWQTLWFVGGYLVLAAAVWLAGLAGFVLFTIGLAVVAVRLTVTGHSAAGSLGPLVGLMAVIALFAIADRVYHWHEPERARFWSLDTLRTGAAQTCVVAVAALGMTIIIISGGIDLSVGVVIALSATVAAWIIKAGALDGSYAVGLVFAAGIAGGVLTGVAAGAVNGKLISFLNVVPFIITLGTTSIFLGIGKLIAAETTVRPPPAAWPDFYRQMLTSFPEPAWIAWPLVPNFAWGVWLALLLALAVAALLNYTVFGRHVYAIGSNELAAKLCGINVPLARIWVYTLAGLFFGIAGMYFFARLFSGSPTSGSGLELRIIAAVVIGGGSLSGGRGSVLGALCGAALMQTIQSGCAALNVSNPIQDILIGVIIVAAVTLDQYREGKLTSENLMTVLRGMGVWRE